MRLWPSLIEKAKNNEDFFMSPGQQKTDFNFIDDVIDGIIKTLNFEKKIKKYPQVWELGSGRTLTVKQFAKIIWKKLNSNGKLIFSKKIVSDKSNYRTDKKKLWKINYTHPSKTVNKL